MTTDETEQSLPAIFGRFLRFGFLAWGGPVAQIAMIKRELVEEERWLPPSRFNRLLAIYQVLPGPEAHELCVHLGMMKRGRLGGLLAGLGFMLPGFVLILALAWLYNRLDLQHPVMAAVFLGVQIGVIALIVRAVHRIADHALTEYRLWAIAIVSAVSAYSGIPFWITIPGAGLLYAALAARRYTIATLVLAMGLLLATETISPGAMQDGAVQLVQARPVGAPVLFLSGLKAGLLTFGGAYTAIPFVREDAVGRGWVSDGQFLDGLALSGIIPAPLIIFATFVGYLAGGMAGALAMTAGIFLPAFTFGILLYDRLERIMDDRRIHRFLEGVTAGVVGLIAATTVHLGINVGQGIPSAGYGVVIFAVALVLLYLWRSKMNVPAVVLGSGALGALFFASS